MCPLLPPRSGPSHPPPGPSPLTLALPVALLERARVGQAAAGPIVRGPCSAGGRSPGGPFRTSTRTSPSTQAASQRRQREARRRGRRRWQSHEGGRRRRRRPCGRRASGQHVPHGRLEGERSEGGGQGLRAPGPVPSQPSPCSGPRFSLAAAPAPGLASAPTPCATRNRTHCRHRHHRRPAPPILLVLYILSSSHELQCLALLGEPWLGVPPTSLNAFFYWFPLSGRSKRTSPPFHWLAEPASIGS